MQDIIYDTNGDGVTTENELELTKLKIEIENRDKKEDQFRKMAWISMISMLALTVILFTPVISTDRITALDNLIQMFYIAQAGVVASFFGSSAYMSRSS